MAAVQHHMMRTSLQKEVRITSCRRSGSALGERCASVPVRGAGLGVVAPWRLAHRNAQRLHVPAATSSDSTNMNSASAGASNRGGDEPSTSNTSSLQPSSGNPREPDSRLGRLLKLLSQYRITSWLAALAERLLKGGDGDGRQARAMRLVRMVFLLACFCVAALFREASIQSTRVKPREVLYSTFVSLLDEGKVRAARLESGSSRLYFDINPQEVEAAASSAMSATAAATTPAAVGVVAKTAASAAAERQVASGAAATAGASAMAQAASSPGAAPTAGAASAPKPITMQRQFFIKLADKSDQLLVHRIVSAGVEFAVVKATLQGALYNILLSALALWLPLMPLIFIIRRIMEDRTGNRGKKKPSGVESVTVTFDDVAGVDSAKQELAEVVSVMKTAKESYKRLKVKMPSGVILCGPPGTGKTLLAKAVAGEAGIPFMAVSASEFVEMYVGRGAARIRELFAEARKSSPCVVFIDELDAVGARRGMGYNDERDQTLNQLLTELDGFEGRSGVLFLAATNRIDVLDPALLRPGRLSRKVVVPLPDEGGRCDILRVHLRGVPLAEGEDVVGVSERLAGVTGGFSGAELANIVNEASLLAARKSQDYVSFREMLEGVQRTRYGVNGRTGGSAANGLGSRISKWLMDVAADSARDRRVRSSTA